MMAWQNLPEFAGESNQATLHGFVIVPAAGVSGDASPRGGRGIDPISTAIVIPIGHHDDRGRPRNVGLGGQPFLDASLKIVHGPVLT